MVSIAQGSRWCVVGAAVFLLGLYSLLGSNAIFYSRSLIYCLATLALMAAGLLFSSRRIGQLFVVITFLLLTSIVPVCFLFIAFPVVVLIPLPIRSWESISLGLEFLVKGTLALVLGMLAVDRLLMVSRSMDSDGSKEELKSGALGKLCISNRHAA